MVRRIQRTYLQVSRVDFVDDLQVAREDTLEHADWPALQGFRQESVVGVREGVGADIPCLVPAQLLHVHQETHQLRDGHGRVSVVQLDCSL